jgi:hypothetical protein
LARKLSEDLVSAWLAQYMFANSPNGAALGAGIASKLADHASFKSHSRFIDRNQAKGLNLVVDDLETNQNLRDDVLSVFHATMHAFNATPCVKIIENHLGKAFVKSAQQQVIVQAQQPPPAPSIPQPQPAPPMPQPPTSPPLS